jgi:DNA-binding MarR family transcriptional regulator
MSAVAQALSLVRELRRLDAAMANPMAEVLLAVADAPGSTTNAIAESCELSMAACASVLSRLSDVPRSGIRGSGFVQSYADPDDARTRLLQLTGKGRDAVARLVGAYGPEGTPQAQPSAPPPGP